MSDEEKDYLPLSYLNHFAYCPRRFWYMYMQGEIAINAPMLEGSLQHQVRADRPGHDTDENGRIAHRRLWVWSDTLNIAGFADFVEETPTQLIPVERKHGQKGKWHNDNIQLCAQALCLEEMTQQSIPFGEIFYWRSRQRVQIPFTAELRAMTKNIIIQALQLRQSNTIPPPITETYKCKHCSIEPICLPAETKHLTLDT